MTDLGRLIGERAQDAAACPTHGLHPHNDATCGDCGLCRPKDAQDAADRRVRPPQPLPDDADCCTVCGVPVALPNQLHTDRPTPVAEAHQAVERRTLGEHD